MERELGNLIRDEFLQTVTLLEEGWSYRQIGRRFTSISRALQGIMLADQSKDDNE